MNKDLSTFQQPGGPGGALWAASVVLVLALAGCDVEWGGIQVKAGEPDYGERPASLEASPDSVGELPPLALPAGPVLFHVRKLDESGRAAIAPIAEITGQGVSVVEPQPVERAEEWASEFVARYYGTSQAYTLFRGRTRVGTFYVRAPTLSGSSDCVELRAEGWVELRLPADSLSEFLAWPAGARVGAETLLEPAYRDDMIVMSQVLARRGVTDGGIVGRWRFGTPADLRALNVGDGRLGFAVTYLVADSLAQGSPADSAGMAFLVADHSPAVGYTPLYFDAAWYGPGSKRALRWLNAADLSGDTVPEWVLRVYGDGGRWYEVIGKREGEYVGIWSSRRPQCDVRQPAPVDLPGD